MTLDETIDLLAVAAAFDRRTLGEADAVAWHAAIGDLAFGDARDAVITHYRESREWIMPSDVRQRVTAVRHARLEAAGHIAIPEELADRPLEAQEWLVRTRRAIADGQEPQRAIGGTP